MITVSNTPIEKYGNIYVKREDLACPAPGPPFSKVRGLEKKLVNLMAEGYRTIGYLDTTISFAGWGVSYFCKHYGIQAVIFYPVYKDGLRHNLPKHLELWKELGAMTVPIRPQMRAITWNLCRKKLREGYPNSFMMEKGFPYPEAIEENSKEVYNYFPV